MPTGSDEAITKLKTFFPGGVKWLNAVLRTAGAEGKKLEGWREQQILKFVECLNINADELETAFRQERISKLAWAARNLLELSIWTDYCNLSDTHAKRFLQDAARDMLGMSKAVQGMMKESYGIEDGKLAKKQNDLVVFANVILGADLIAEDYERVIKAAVEVGREKEFANLNKMFSKFAHPTAWAVNSVFSRESDKDLRELFLSDGVVFSTQTFVKIREFVFSALKIAEDSAAVQMKE